MKFTFLFLIVNAFCSDFDWSLKNRILVGAGKNDIESKKIHVIPSVVDLAHDLTIDLDESIEPDIVGDMWNPETIKSLPNDQFREIAFEHVGIGFPFCSGTNDTEGDMMSYGVVVKDFLPEYHRILQPGGRFIYHSTVNALPILKFILEDKFKKTRSGDFRSPHRELLEQAGFKNIEIEIGPEFDFDRVIGQPGHYSLKILAEK